jgi:hypothetical protein
MKRRKKIANRILVYHSSPEKKEVSGAPIGDAKEIDAPHTCGAYFSPLHFSPHAQHLVFRLLKYSLADLNNDAGADCRKVAIFVEALSWTNAHV